MYNAEFLIFVFSLSMITISFLRIFFLLIPINSAFYSVRWVFTKFIPPVLVFFIFSFFVFHRYFS